MTTIVAGVWIPLAARLTSANTDDGEVAVEMLPEVPNETRYLLGDQHYNREQLRAACQLRSIELVATKPGRYPHTDAGVEVRRLFHKLRSVAMENFNEHFKDIFSVHGQVPTKGQKATACFALGAVFVYQLAIWQRFEQGLPTNVGLKYYLKAT